MSRPLVIYHANCFDGFTSAWVFRRFLGECEWHAASYGGAPPDVAGREVYVVDFSYPRDVMQRLILAASCVVVLDHHQTAESALAGLLDELKGQGWAVGASSVVFDMNRSGAGLAWDCLFQQSCPGKVFAKIERPWLVDYVEDRDLWRHALPHSAEVSAYIASLPMTFEAWDALEELGADEAARRGAAVQQYIDSYGAKAREQARFEQLAGYRVPTINVPYMNCSEHVNALAEQYPAAPFAASYFRRSDGRWQFSLRSRSGPGRPSFDVSVVAKEFGGGGHRHAAGFDVSSLPWDTARANEAASPAEE